MPQVDKWCEQAKKFHERCSAISQMYSRLTSIANRPLLYDLYQYAWDAKESTMLLDSYVSWLGEPLLPLATLVHAQYRLSWGCPRLTQVVLGVTQVDPSCPGGDPG